MSHTTTAKKQKLVSNCCGYKYFEELMSRGPWVVMHNMCGWCRKACELVSLENYEKEMKRVDSLPKMTIQQLGDQILGTAYAARDADMESFDGSLFRRNITPLLESFATELLDEMTKMVGGYEEHEVGEHHHIGYFLNGKNVLREELQTKLSQLRTKYRKDL